MPDAGVPQVKAAAEEGNEETPRIKASSASDLC